MVFCLEWDVEKPELIKELSTMIKEN